MTLDVGTSWKGHPLSLHCQHYLNEYDWRTGGNVLRNQELIAGQRRVSQGGQAHSLGQSVKTETNQKHG